MPAICEQCGTDFHARVDAIRAGKGRFCTPACWRQSITRRPATAHCEACGTSFEPTWQKHGLSRFCSTTCANRRRHVAVRHCEHCGTAYQRASRPGRFCTRACSAAAQRKRVQHVCEECGAPWETYPSSQKTRFCTQACWAAAWRRHWAERAGLVAPSPGEPLRTTLTCERCEEPFEVLPSRARERRFCSRSCAHRHDRRRQITCVICGATPEVFLSRLERGPVLYCSRKCRGIGSRGPRVETVCAQCGKHGEAPASKAIGRWFCSPICYQRAIAPRVARCRACRTSFRIYPWQARCAQLHSGRIRRYCSLSCANRGRKVARHPLLARRNRRIIELHLAGYRAPKILTTLATEHEDWSAIVPATVRQVLTRECAHCQARRQPSEVAA